MIFRMLIFSHISCVVNPPQLTHQPPPAVKYYESVTSYVLAIVES